MQSNLPIKVALLMSKPRLRSGFCLCSIIKIDIGISITSGIGWKKILVSVSIPIPEEKIGIGITSGFGGLF